MKLLSNKPHLSDKYWALAYKDVLLKSNILPMINMLTAPYQLWNESPEPINLDFFPMLPFGSVVMAPCSGTSTIHTPS